MHILKMWPRAAKYNLWAAKPMVDCQKSSSYFPKTNSIFSQYFFVTEYVQ